MLSSIYKGPMYIVAKKSAKLQFQRVTFKRFDLSVTKYVLQLILHARKKFDDTQNLLCEIFSGGKISNHPDIIVA